MDISLMILALSIGLQLTAVCFAISLMRYAEKRIIAVAFISAFMLMSIRRLHSIKLLFTSGSKSIDLTAEIISLLVSIFLLCGIILISKLIRSSKKDKISEIFANERYRALFDQSPDGVLLMDSSGSIIDFNDAVNQQLGYTREEFCKLQIADIDPVESPEEIGDRFGQVLKDGKQEFEVKHKTKQGDIRNVLVIIQPITISEETYFHAIWRDITERHVAEKEREQFYKFFESATDMMCIADPNGAFLRINPACSQLLGYSTDELISKPFIDFVHPEDKQSTLDEMSRQVKIGASLNFENRYLCKDGSIRHLSWKASYNKDEGVTYAVARDVTELKRTEKALRESEFFFKESQRAAAIGSYTTDFITGIWESSIVLDSIFGIDASYVRNVQGWLDLVHPSDKEMMRRYLQDEIIAKGIPFLKEYRIVRINDGATRWVYGLGEVHLDDNGKVVSLIGTIQDISTRKNAEEDLERIFSLSSDMICTASLSGHFLTTNPAFEKTLGYSKEELLAKPFLEFVHPDDRDITLALIQEKLSQGITALNFENRYQRKDGTYAWLSWTSNPVPEKGITYGIARDISDRKETESRLRKSEEFIRNILDTVDEGFIVIDKDFHILTSNNAYCTQVGCAGDEIVGKHCYEISHNINRPCYEKGEECVVREVFATGDSHVVVHKHTDLEGNVLYVETKGFPIRNDEGDIISVIETINNITEKFILEEERLKIQKLESIGTLAGGIAHDFNNLLQGVFGYISLAKMGLDNKEECLAAMEQAEKAIHQSVNLTNQLLTFSKGGKPRKKLTNLKVAIENATKFALSGSKSSCKIIVEDGLWQVEVDEGQIGQVIQNIVLNADQAMPDGGEVDITVKNISANDNHLPKGLSNGDCIAIAISDNGVGISERNMSKIFDPYFTTKAMGSTKGSGLGLATSYSIINNHNGSINVTSTENCGSTFTIYLPALPLQSIMPVKTEEIPTSIAVGRVLFMDDEEMIRDLASKLITALGHDVELAEHGNEAVEKFIKAKQNANSFDVVILDLTIRGGMGGIETVQELLKIDPGLKAIVSSGYSDSSASSSYKKQGFKAFLNKPYNFKELREVLNNIIQM
ncbi:MAG: PAS domain S-box protein [Desulfobulbaceae bacterium]|nr:PAS domain S-box protein [Desulfobulbaceae bacterium]